MSEGDRDQSLLERATAALERIDATMARQAEAFDAQAQAFDRQAESHDRMMRRIDRRDDVIIQTLGDIDLSIKRNTDRLEDMGDAIRANTRAVLSILDRLGPATS